MRPVLICPDDLVEHLVGNTTSGGERPVYVVNKAALRARISRRGERALAGDPQDPEFLREVVKGGRGPIVVGARPAEFPRIVAALNESVPGAPVLVVRDDERPLAGATIVSLAAFGERVIQPALDRACQRARAERVRELMEGAERILILMQDDPDPDAIASAMALKTLLGRSRVSAPICTFGSITRPENVAMCKILDVEVQEISGQALDQFDRVAMVDVQPSFLEERFEEVDLVIDHHPVDRPI
ncbi:MAG TPA: hypothetical protein VEL75_09745, partial [Candidatus Methylomirabilis sp.]|nr:hypothetical protein [Candidatus Methylomirabilis sp.]